MAKGENIVGERRLFNVQGVYSHKLWRVRKRVSEVATGLGHAVRSTLEYHAVGSCGRQQIQRGKAGGVQECNLEATNVTGCKVWYQ